MKCIVVFVLNCSLCVCHINKYVCYAAMCVCMCHCILNCITPWSVWSVCIVRSARQDTVSVYFFSFATASETKRRQKQSKNGFGRLLGTYRQEYDSNVLGSADFVLGCKPLYRLRCRHSFPYACWQQSFSLEKKRRPGALHIYKGQCSVI